MRRQGNTQEEQSQLKRLASSAPPTYAAESAAAQRQQQLAIMDNKSVFEGLVDAVRVCLLGQITNAFAEVGGLYWRNTCATGPGRRQ